MAVQERIYELVTMLRRVEDERDQSYRDIAELRGLLDRERAENAALRSELDTALRRAA